MTNIEIEAYFTIAIAVIFIALFVPLWLRKVPMNAVYGIRTAETFQSKEDWYAINAEGGRIVVISILPILVIGISKLFLPQELFGYLNLSALVLPLLIGAALSHKAKQQRALGAQRKHAQESQTHTKREH